MKLLVISTSLNPQSVSAPFGGKIFEHLKKIGHDVEWLQLRDYALPLCNAASAYDHPDTKFFAQKISAANGVFLMVPIHNYQVCAATKNLLEVTGAAFKHKVVALSMVSGGEMSFLAPLAFINSLIVDMECVIVPKWVYMPGHAFENGLLKDPSLEKRLYAIADQFAQYTGAIKDVIAEPK